MAKYNAYIAKKYIIEDIDPFSKGEQSPDEMRERVLKELEKNPEKYFIKNIIKIKKRG